MQAVQHGWGFKTWVRYYSTVETPTVSGTTPL